MRRRDVLKGAAVLGASLLARPAIAQDAQKRVLKFIPQANLTSLDPIWTSANVTRNHGYMVYDTLYGLDDKFQPQPQLAEGHVEEDEGRTVIITLRSGPRFHDGEPVRAQDAAQSINRWMKRSPVGQTLARFTESVEAIDDRKVKFRLKRAFPKLLKALAQVSSSPAFIMPERIAKTDPFQQVRDATGSGPFRFIANEFNSGSFAAYERYAQYSPSPVGVPSLTAGPKLPMFDRVEWNIIIDAATATAALQNGEADWYEQPPPELQDLLKTNPKIAVEAMDPLPLVSIMRFNFLQPPFNDKKLRQALLPAISQADFMTSIVGPNPSLYREGVGVFTPGTPLASDAGLDALKSPRNIERAKALMREAGYTNQPMRLIGPTDILAPSALTQVGIDLVLRLGFNADIALSDWGTVLQRRTSKEPVEKGGWSMMFNPFIAIDFADPFAHFPLRGNGADAWTGWPTMPRLEELREAWLFAPDLDAQRAIGREMQIVAMDELPFIPVGAYISSTALRRDLTHRIPGMALMWNIRRG
jgi:peptide/nickel transport system substrate-binding protein